MLSWNTPILKSSIFNDEQLNTCPNCDKHFIDSLRVIGFNMILEKIIGKKLILLKLRDDPLNWPNDVYKEIS